MKPTFGQRMNARRQLMDYTWQRLSELCGIKTQTLKELALGRHQAMPQTMIAVAKVLMELHDNDSYGTSYERCQWQLLHEALAEFYEVKETVKS